MLVLAMTLPLLACSDTAGTNNPSTSTNSTSSSSSSSSSSPSSSSSTPSSSEDKPKEPDVTKLWVDYLPEDLNYGGKDVFFAVGGQNGTDLAAQILPDSIEGDAMIVEHYKMNKKIEDRLGVKFKVAATSSPALINGSVLTSLQAGNGDYDIVTGPIQYDVALANSGLLCNLNELNNIDLTQGYWGGSINKYSEYKGYQSWVTGPITFTYWGRWYSVIVNLDLYNKYVFPEYGSIFDLVKKGEWTIDVFTDMIDMVFMDSGDVQDKADPADQLGLATSRIRYEALSYGLGVQYSTVDAEGNVSIALDSPATLAAAQKFMEIEACVGSYTPNLGEWQIPVFVKGKSLFAVEVLADTVNLSRAKFDYTVLPTPKMNNDPGTRYYSGFNGWLAAFGIPTSAKDPEMSAAVLEALAGEAYRSIKPVYYESILKYKYTQNNNTAEMVDLIVDSAYIDFAMVWNEKLDRLIFYFMDQDLSTVQSTLKGSIQAWETMLDKVLKEFEDNCLK